MAYDEKRVVSGKKPFKVCKLLFAESTYPTDIANKLETSQSSAGNILRELRELNIVEKVESSKKENAKKQYYNLNVEGLVQYCIERNKEILPSKEVVELRDLVATGMKEELEDFVEEMIEVENKMEDADKDEVNEKYEELWRNLRSQSGRIDQKFRLNEDTLTEFYRDNSKGLEELNVPKFIATGLELEAISMGADPKGVRELIKNFVRRYLTVIEESSIEDMLFDDLEKSVLYYSWYFEQREIEFEPLMTLSDVYFFKNIAYKEENPYSSLAIAALNHSRMNEEELIRDMTEYSIGQNNFNTGNKEDSIEKFLERLESWKEDKDVQL